MTGRRKRRESLLRRLDEAAILFGAIEEIVMAKHGRATMPWGRWKGVRIRLLPDDYLSWLTSSAIMDAPQWWWLRESLIAELKFRGMRYDLAKTPDPEPIKYERPKREIHV